MSTLFEVVLLLLSLPTLVASGYLVLLTLLSFWPAAAITPRPGGPTFRFDVFVPAYDEASGIADTVASLRALDYPEHLRRIVVIADNCSDDTAAVAARAGAVVLERTDPERRGKGQALAWAFQRSAQEGFADAVVVVDADTLVAPNLLRAFDARLALGAQALQAEYSVRNPGASWRTRLMAVALGAFHQVRSLGRERLGVSSGLRGNGMCLRGSLLREVPYDAFSQVEDLEFGLRLGWANHRVEYVSQTSVHGEMVSGEEGSRSQRRRWEQGRAALRKASAWPLFRAALARRSGLLLDLSLDLLVPPLAGLALVTVLGLAGGLALWVATGLAGAASIAFLAALLGLLGYVLAGWSRSGSGLAGLVCLACAPVYLVWKLWLSRGPRLTGWSRTTREPRRDP